MFSLEIVSLIILSDSEVPPRKLAWLEIEPETCYDRTRTRFLLVVLDACRLLHLNSLFG